jgi:hypothetical protein
MEENTVSRSHIALRAEVAFAAQDSEKNKPVPTRLERRDWHVVLEMNMLSEGFPVCKDVVPALGCEG